MELKAVSKLPTAYAEFWLRVYVDPAEDKEQIALGLGDPPFSSPTLLRLHSECLTGDALFSLRCDCGFQLEAAMQRIATEGEGLLLYLRQEGRGIGLANKIRAYALQDTGVDTVEANEQLGFAPDMRDYTAGLEILRDLGVAEARLMTNNPRKVAALEAGGITVSERIPMECGRNPHNDAYLATKAGKLGHLLTSQAESEPDPEA